MIRRRIFKLMKWGVVVFGVGLFTLLGIRIYDSQNGPPLEPWHTYIPHELSPDELDHAGWGDYLKAEDVIFDRLRKEVTQKLAPGERTPINRYFDGSPIYPGHFAQDWNRSYVMEPASAPIGAAVFLHGLTDSPYSLRHIAQHYRDAGYVSIAIRLPGHGTVPGALTTVEWQDWMAATRLAIREARRYRDKAHLKFVALQACLVCARQPSDPHHLRFAQPRALSRKVSDEFTVPLCRAHHREVHRTGNEQEWWKPYSLDPHTVASALWVQTHSVGSAAQVSSLDQASERRTKHAPSLPKDPQNHKTKPIDPSDTR